MRFFVGFILSLGLGLQALANDQEALQNTIELLKDTKARDEAIAKDADAKKADAYAKQVGGPLTENIYALSAKVFEKLVKKYGTDMSKLNEILQKALRDPAGFASSEFSAEELSELKAISDKLPQSKPNPN